MKIRKAKKKPKGTGAYRGKHPKVMIRELEENTRVINLIARGATTAHIAQALGHEPRGIAHIINRALAEYRTNHEEMVTRIASSIEARQNAIVRAYIEDALGGIRVDPETGVRTVIPRQPKAAEVVQRSDRILAYLIRSTREAPQTTVVTSGPVITSHVDEMEMARIMRAQFTNDVIDAPALEAADIDDAIDAHAAE